MKKQILIIAILSFLILGVSCEKEPYLFDNLEGEWYSEQRCRETIIFETENSLVWLDYIGDTIYDCTYSMTEETFFIYYRDSSVQEMDIVFLKNNELEINAHDCRYFDAFSRLKYIFKKQ